MDLKELESGVDPATHWYYQSKKIPLVAYVKKVFAQRRVPLTLVDVGSGSGFFMYELMKEIPQMISKVYLVDIGYTEEEINATKNQSIEKTRLLPEKIETAVVVMMDVLEHLEDDHGMLRAISEKCSGENYFFITVPAFLHLWSGHDTFLGHKRRYTLKTLRALLRKENYRESHLYYAYGLIYFIAWMKRKVFSASPGSKSDMRPAPPVVNYALRAYNSIEMSFSKVNRLVGLTCVAEGII